MNKVFLDRSKKLDLSSNVERQMNREDENNKNKEIIDVWDKQHQLERTMKQNDLG
jgi:hypothetical protein